MNSDGHRLATTWAELRVRLDWFGRQLMAQFNEHDCLASAAALTYTTLFAVVPVMTVTYTIFSVLPEFSALGSRVQDLIFNNFVPTSSTQVQTALQEFSARARKLSGVGFAVLFVTAFVMLVNIEKTFNGIWHVTEPRRGFQRILLYWAVLSLGPPLALAGMLVSLYLTTLPFFADLGALQLESFALRALPLLLSGTAFTVLYFAVPNCDVPLRDAVLGGVLTTMAFEVAKWMFTTAISNSSFEPIYGTFAIVPIFLIWLNLCWVVVLSGAIFVRTLSLPREYQDVDAPPIIKAGRVLALVQEAHRDGTAVSEGQLNKAVPMSLASRKEVFEALQSLKLIRLTETDEWCLGRSLRSVTLWDLYQLLPGGISPQSLKHLGADEPLVEPLQSLVEFGSNRMAVTLDTALKSA